MSGLPEKTKKVEASNKKEMKRIENYLYLLYNQKMKTIPFEQKTQQLVASHQRAREDQFKKLEANLQEQMGRLEAQSKQLETKIRDIDSLRDRLKNFNKNKSSSAKDDLKEIQFIGKQIIDDKFSMQYTPLSYSTLSEHSQKLHANITVQES